MSAHVQLGGNLRFGVITGTQQGARFFKSASVRDFGLPPRRPRRRAALSPALTRWRSILLPADIILEKIGLAPRARARNAAASQRRPQQTGNFQNVSG
jgi:hypothetical protein